MTIATKQILLHFDEDGCWETPSNFDYAQLLADIMALKNALEHKFGLPFELVARAQDASFFCDLLIPQQLITDVTRQPLKPAFLLLVARFWLLVQL